MRHTTSCADCYREVLWTITEAGKRLPVDPEPDATGNAAVYRDGTGTTRSRRPSEELPLMGWERLHVPHIATCPKKRPAPAAPVQRGPLPAGVSDLSMWRQRSRGRL